MAAAATRKLHSDIEFCLKRLAEKVLEFDLVWAKLYPSGNTPIIPHVKEKLEDDLKRNIKKLQRYREQIRTWLLCEEILDKSELAANRTLIESRMVRFRSHQRDVKTKAFSKKGLVSQGLDPVEKERDDAKQWINDSIDTLKFQSDQLECKIELTLKTKIVQGEMNYHEDLQSRMDRHAFHIEKLESLLRMLDNMSIEVEVVENIKEDVEWYIDAWNEDGFIEDEDIYADIIGLLGSDNVPPQTVKTELPDPDSGHKVSTVQNIPKGNRCKVKYPSVPCSKHKRQKRFNKLKKSTGPKCVPIRNRVGQNKRMSNTSLEASPPNTSSAIQNFIEYVNCSQSLTFATIAATKQPQTTESKKTVTLPEIQNKRLPSLLELYISPPLSLGKDAPQEQQTVSGSSSDISSGGEDKVQDTIKEEDLPSGSTTNRSNVPPTEEYGTYLTELKCEEKSDVESGPGSIIDDGEQPETERQYPTFVMPDTKLCVPLQSRCWGLSEEGVKFISSLKPSSQRCPTTHHPFYFCTFLPPIPVVAPSYYPQTADGILSQSPKAFYDKLDNKTLLFFFYYAENGLLQLLAARALKRKGWRYHKLHYMWFIRYRNQIEVNEFFEKGKYIYFDPSNVREFKTTDDNFVFYYRFLDDIDHDKLLRVYQL